ncbi:prepilin-type N-terminal cleavage/methylation domain-containing protein [Gammaproteobacteria bacterium]|jgi:prepilin-type N-terminal cleavage/methylation domain-containing protein|nr:prepilin-type N-terminal cleavage/methylation domain-containing protein [Gammaproteobacteria bacterium]MDA9986149.1 prepilin-type N-terminal cleavage/methylation domain-containing protein [bacterium]
MECPGELVRILILETGCSKKTKGFTLIEVLVVLVIIGITSSLLFLNIGLADTVSKNKLSLNTLFNYLSEESIITGNLLAWHANDEKDLIYVINYQMEKQKLLDNVQSPWKDFSSNRKTFKHFDGSIIQLNENDLNKPLIIFYPSGENTGGIITISSSNFIQEITINNNGKIETKIIEY